MGLPPKAGVGPVSCTLHRRRTAQRHLVGVPRGGGPGRDLHRTWGPGRTRPSGVRAWTHATGIGPAVAGGLAWIALEWCGLRPALVGAKPRMGLGPGGLLLGPARPGGRALRLHAASGLALGAGVKRACGPWLTPLAIAGPEGGAAHASPGARRLLSALSGASEPLAPCAAARRAVAAHVAHRSGRSLRPFRAGRDWANRVGPSLPLSSLAPEP